MADARPSTDDVDGAIDWAAAQDAYGSAIAVPDLLARASASPDDSDTWDALWSRLCHQGTVYEASFLAIPALAAVARSAIATAYSQPLNLLAAIAASTDIHGAPDTRFRYADSLASCLPAAVAYAGAAADDTDFCYALSVIAGLRGERAWHHVLTFLADGAAPGTCPGCGEDLCLHLDATPPRVSLSWDEPPDGTEIVPADPITAQGFGADLLILASRHSRTTVTTRLLALLGECLCPACGTGFSPGRVLRPGAVPSQMPHEDWTDGYEFTELLRDLRETSAEASTLHAELLREIGLGHVLHGIEVRVIARATPQDDVIVQTADGRVALVHMTWSGHPETPPWPTTELVTSSEHLDSLIAFRY